MRKIEIANPHSQTTTTKQEYGVSINLLVSQSNNIDADEVQRIALEGYANEARRNCAPIIEA